MPKLILQQQMSLDGFVCDQDKSARWVFSSLDDEYAAWGAPRLWDASAHLMGRVTYGDMAAHWPTSDEPYAAPMNGIPKIVFSRTLTTAGWGETTILSGDLAAEIARLKRGDGKPLLAHGGASFARALIETGLVDEYRLISHPVAVGQGHAIFAGLKTPLYLRAVEAVPFKSGGVARHFLAT